MTGYLYYIWKYYKITLRSYFYRFLTTLVSETVTLKFAHHFDARRRCLLHALATLQQSHCDRRSCMAYINATHNSASFIYVKAM
jgi:uncharacterized membrane protein YoaT (DUF817 family)